MKKVLKCNVKLGTKKNSVSFEEIQGEKEDTVERMKTRSMTNKIQDKQYSIGTFD